MKKIKFVVVILTIFGLALTSMNSVLAYSPPELTTEQKAAIIDHCDVIRKNLQNVQHQDSRMRVYYGRSYETIFSKFIVPLNMRLTENNLLNDNLLNNQTKFAVLRADFSADYVEYQKSLEELVSTNCKDEPERFYELLTQTRLKRQIVNGDVIDIRKVITAQIELVTKLKESL